MSLRGKNIDTKDEKYKSFFEMSLLLWKVHDLRINMKDKNFEFQIFVKVREIQDRQVLGSKEILWTRIMLEVSYGDRGLKDRVRRVPDKRLLMVLKGYNLRDLC